MKRSKRRVKLDRAVVPPDAEGETRESQRTCLPEHMLPFHGPDGETLCQMHTVYTPRYVCVELPANSLLFKGVDDAHSKVACSKFDSNIAWFSNLEVAAGYERRPDRPKFRLRGKEARLPCVWYTTRTLVLMDLTNISNLRNFIADLVQHVRDTYRTQRGKEREMQREMERVQRQFRGLFGVNPLLGDGDMDRNSVTEDDLYMFTNFCDIIAPKHRLDGYIAWPMASTSQEWDRRNMFHPELMLCNPMSKIRELQPGEELQLLERLQQPAPTAATTLARTMK